MNSLTEIIKQYNTEKFAGFMSIYIHCKDKEAQNRFILQAEKKEYFPPTGTVFT